MNLKDINEMNRIPTTYWPADVPVVLAPIAELRVYLACNWWPSMQFQQRRFLKRINKKGIHPGVWVKPGIFPIFLMMAFEIVSSETLWLATWTDSNKFERLPCQKPWNHGWSPVNKDSIRSRRMALQILANFKGQPINPAWNKAINEGLWDQSINQNYQTKKGFTSIDRAWSSLYVRKMPIVCFRTWYRTRRV